MEILWQRSGNKVISNVKGFYIHRLEESRHVELAIPQQLCSGAYDGVVEAWAISLQN